MEDAEPEERNDLLRKVLIGLAIAVAFVVVSSLFAVILRPLAEPHGVREPQLALKPSAPATAALVSAPQAAAKAEPLSVPPPAIKPAEPLPAGPKVAILVTEIGADEALGRQAIDKLPKELSLAFLPASPLSRPLARRAAAAGHEVWIGLPMQPKSWPRVSPGPNTLVVADPPADNVRRVNWALAQVDAPVGAYTMMGSAFTADARAMAPVATAIKTRNIVLLDARSVGGTIAAKSVKDAGGRALSNNYFIDSTLSASSIDATLARLVAQAKRDGQAVGIARALPLTISRLSIWSGTLDGKGVTLVPVARLAQ